MDTSTQGFADIGTLIPFLSFHTKRCCLGSHPSPSSSLHGHEDPRRWSRRISRSQRIGISELPLEDDLETPSFLGILLLDLCLKYGKVTFGILVKQNLNDYELRSLSYKRLCLATIARNLRNFSFFVVSRGWMPIRKKKILSNCRVLGPNLEYGKSGFSQILSNISLYLSHLTYPMDSLVFYPSLNCSTLSLSGSHCHRGVEWHPQLKLETPNGPLTL